MKEIVSVVIRTLNEQKHLDELLLSIQKQESNRFDIEVVIVDSGSTDNTLEIARKYNSKITYIKKEDFTFGRSLNIGCDFAKGAYLIFVSGHCIPASNNWLHNLVSPLADKQCAYSYGKQIGRDTTKFSEQQLFDKYFPDESKVPQVGFFCNNANSALLKDIWEKIPFDEKLTGLEDMYLAQKIIESGDNIAYIAEAPVYHIHDESWAQVKNRYEREAIALQKIIPELHFEKLDFFNCFIIGVLKDLKSAQKKGVLLKEMYSIIRFRLAQYHGAYSGNHIHRKLSYEMKMKYFYPLITNMDVKNDK